MFKTTLFIIMTLFMSLSAWGRPAVPTHEDFVHLSQREQEEFVIKLMEMAVEIEANYQHEVKKYGYNKERFEKYTKALKEIYSVLFISSAYAGQEEDLWSSQLAQYSSLLSKPNSCLFAGWVSQTYKNDKGQTICGHPSYMTNVAASYNSARKNNRCGDEEDKGKIQCNPIIFGYKKKSTQSLFCVSTTNGAENSSYHCMKQALKERDGRERRHTDDPRTRLNFLRQQFAQNKESYEMARNFVYKSCMCKDPGSRDADYQAKMRPHQTCYGLMEMLRSTTYTYCTNPPQVLPQESDDLFKKLQTHMRDYSGSDPQGVAQHYAQFISIDLESPANDQELMRVCQGMSYVCKEATCIDTGKTVNRYQCTVTAEETTPSGKKTVTFNEAKPFTDFTGQSKFDFAGNYEGKNLALNCDVKIKPDYRCKAQCFSDVSKVEMQDGMPVLDPNLGAPRTCNKFTVTKMVGDTEEPVTLAEEPSERTIYRENEVTISAKIGDATESIKCSVENVGPPITCTATCVANAPATPATGDAARTTASAQGTTVPAAGGQTAVTDTAAAATATAGSYTCNSYSIKKGDVDVNYSDPTPATKVITNEAEIPLQIKVGEDTQSIKCKVEKKELTPDEGQVADTVEPEKDPELKVSITKKEDAFYMVKAEPATHEGWTFKWKLTKPEGKAVETKWTATTAATTSSAPAVVLANDGSVPEAGAATAGGSPETPSDNKEVTQKRYDFDYQLCGTLAKTGKTTQEKCVKIDKLKKANAPIGGGMNPNQGPPPVQIRGTSDTSAMGIR